MVINFISYSYCLTAFSTNDHLLGEDYLLSMWGNKRRHHGMLKTVGFINVRDI